MFKFEPHAPFRGEKGDIAVKIVTVDGQKILCSNPFDKNVILLSIAESEIKLEDGQFRYDSAWECTIEADRPDVDDILKDYLIELEKDFRNERRI